MKGVTVYQNGLGIDDKLRSKNGTTVRYFITDHLGSTVALADSSGRIVSSTSYDSFGNAATSIPTSYRYTGREYDSDTGLYYYRNRWYDPKIGRFISEDPIGFAGGDINLYGYVGNNPLSFIDPFGFRGCPSWWDAVQGALDVAGLAPVVGLPADLLNAGISAARGNYTDAALSMAAAVPVIGTAAGAGKIAHRATKLLPSLQVPNAGGKIVSYVTKKDEVFSRVFSGDSTRGGFLTKVAPTNQRGAIEGLALPPGNNADFIQKVLVPAGTRVQRSRALPAFGRRGGKEQFQLLDKIPNKNFGSGVPLK